MNNEDNNQNKDGLKNVAQSAPKAMKTIEKIKKRKVAIAVISAIAPILGWLVLALFLFMAIMMPIIYISEKKEEALDTIDKFINFITLEGWGKSETRFFENLKEEYDWYETLNNKEGELDIPLIAATIHYGTIVNPESYEYDDDSDKYTEYKYNDKDPVIPSNQLRSFYIVANDKIGKADPIYLGEKKLLGHLVDIKFTTKCLDTPPSIIEAIFTGEWDEWGELGEEARKSFEDFWNVLKHSLVDNVTLTVKKANVIKTAQLMIEYAKQDQNKFVADIGNEFHELKHDNALRRLYDIVKNSDLTNTCGEDQISIPIMTRFINYERYKTYLRETFLPLEPYNNCKGCVYKNADTDRQEVLIERMITEIFDQRDAYQHLKGNSDSSDNSYSTYIPGLTSFPVPLNSEGKFRISSKFGMRHHPIYNDYRMHKGIDLPLAHGQPVYSIADGEVIHAGCQAKGCAKGYGKYVLIQHDIDGNGKPDYYTLYAHLSVINTVNGAKVGGGQKIGEIGSTGTSTGPHLHLEIQDEKRNPIDPEPILNGIIKGNSVFDNTPTTTYYNQDNFAHVKYCSGMTGTGGVQATIATSGCLPTSYAMVAVKLGYNMDPTTVANYICKNTGYRINGSGTSSAFFTASQVEKHFKINATAVTNRTIDNVVSILKSGKPIIVSVKNGHFNPSGRGHFIVIDSIDGNNNIKILDPGSRTKTNVPYSKEQIKNYVLNHVNSGMWYFERG